jgi:DNA polymerase III subunit gamma/tau
MAYQVIARKWRPQTFGEVIGQEHVTRTLANAIVSGRVAHAYIFSGARGVGKTTTARILAKALNCAKGPAAEPCNECDSCREISAGSSMDVIEIDAASNRGIDQIRELREMVRYAPASSRYKVVILDEAHMLTDEASNALLKTLEEPPDRVVFILATTEPDELAETIRSRSQHFHFRALSFAEITAALGQIVSQEKWNVEPGALAVMARAAEGSVRDALSLLEQARAYSGETITDAQVRELLGVVPQETLDQLTAAIEQRSATLALELVHGLLAQGQNLPSFCREAIGHFRNLLVAKVCGAESELVSAPAGERPGIARAAAAFSEEDLTRFFEILLETHDDLRRKPDERLHLEMGLLRMVNAARLEPLEQVLAELGGAGANSAQRVGKASSAAAASAAASSSPSSPSFTAPAAVSAPRVASSSSPSSSLSSSSSPSSSPAPAATPRVERAASESAASGVPVATKPEGAVARMVSVGGGLEAAQVEAIKVAALEQQKFLGELVEQASRWEREGAEVRLFFPTERRALAEMLQSREQIETLRNIAQRVVGPGVRVCVKLEASPVAASEFRAAGVSRELRAQFERDPIVRAMLERFGGQISDVKRGDEV